MKISIKSFVIISTLLILIQSCQLCGGDDEPTPNPTTLTIHVKSMYYFQGELQEDKDVEGAVVYLYPSEEDRLNSVNLISKKLTNDQGKVVFVDHIQENITYSYDVFYQGHSGESLYPRTNWDDNTTPDTPIIAHTNNYTMTNIFGPWNGLSPTYVLSSVLGRSWKVTSITDVNNIERINEPKYRNYIEESYALFKNKNARNNDFLTPDTWEYDNDTHRLQVFLEGSPQTELNLILKEINFGYIVGWDPYHLVYFHLRS